MLTHLSSPEVRKRGLDLKLRKCCIWWPSEPPPSVQQLYPQQVRQDYSEGTEVLTAPLGSDAFTRDWFLNRIEDLQPFFDAVAELPDLQVAYTMLRYCLGTARVTYLLRLIPPHLTSQGCIAFDGMMRNCVTGLLDGALHGELWQELQLPVHTSARSGSATLGIGLTSAVTLAPCAFLSSAFSSRKLCDKIYKGSLPPLSSTLKFYKPSRCGIHFGTHLTSRKHTAPSVLGSCVPPSQKALTDAAHKGVTANLPPGDLSTVALRKCMQIPGAKDWLNCMPSPALNTWIPDRLYLTWFKFYCSIPLYNDHEPCARAGCKVLMDPHGDHALVCPRGSPLSLRHDSLVRRLAALLSQAARRPVVEQRDNGTTHNSRPDITAFGMEGDRVMLDVTVVHPLTRSRVHTTASTPVPALSSATHAKRTQHRGLLTELQGTHSLLPLPIHTVGGWNTEARDYICGVADARALRYNESRGMSRAKCFASLGACLVQNNASCLLASMQASNVAGGL